MTKTLVLMLGILIGVAGEAVADEVTVKRYGEMVGRVVSQTPHHVVLEMASGVVLIPRSRIKKRVQRMGGAEALAIAARLRAAAGYLRRAAELLRMAITSSTRPEPLEAELKRLERRPNKPPPALAYLPAGALGRAWAAMRAPK